MGATLTVRAIHDDKNRFLARARENPPVWIDHTPPAGEGAGYLAMEMLLVSLATSSCQTLLSLLRRMSQKITAMEALARGTRSDDLPGVFTKIELDFTIRGDHIDPRLVEKGIAMVEERYCPIWAMLKKSVTIQANCSILDEKEKSSGAVESEMPGNGGIQGKSVE
jgi:putative redox protein